MTVELEQAIQMADVIFKNRMETDKSGRLSPAVEKALRNTELCQLGLEKEFGGIERNPVISLQVFETLAKHEGAVAWIVWNSHLACTFGKFLSRDAREMIFSKAGNIYSNSTRPGGIAKVTSTGYEVTGSWTLVSGCELSDWFALRCLIQTSDETPTPSPTNPVKILFIPKKEIEIIKTWNVGGLRGTGSHDVRVTSAKVPIELAISYQDPVKVKTNYAQLPVGCINSAGNASIALGLAQVSLDSIIESGRNRVTPGASPDFRDREAIQLTVAKVMADLSSARKYLHYCVDELWDSICNGNGTNLEMISSIWSASINAALTAKKSASRIYSIAGTAALYESNPLERSHRDIHAVLQHGIIQPHWLQQSGRLLFGLDSTAPIFKL